MACVSMLDWPYAGTRCGCVYQQSDAEMLQLDGLGVGAVAADSPGHLA